MVAGVEEAVGLLVANAAYMSMGPFLEQDTQDWWRQIDTNLSGTFYLVRAVVPGMRRLGGGRIVIVSSEWGVTGWPNASAYAASKAGLISLGKTLDRELAPEGIITNVVAPGVIDTPQLENDARDADVSLEEIKPRYAAETPVGRIGRPEEIAAAGGVSCSQGFGSFRRAGDIAQRRHHPIRRVTGCHGSWISSPGFLWFGSGRASPSSSAPR